MIAELSLLNYFYRNILFVTILQYQPMMVINRMTTSQKIQLSLDGLN